MIKAIIAISVVRFNINPNVEFIKWRRILIDFEYQLHAALAQMIVMEIALSSNIQVSGCVFHFCDALIANVNKYGGMPSYREHGKFYRFIRYLFALPYVPLPAMREAYYYIHREMWNDADDTIPPFVWQFMSYFEEYWLWSSKLPLSAWNVYDIVPSVYGDVLSPIERIRTTGPLEGLHNKYKQYFGVHSSLWSWMSKAQHYTKVLRVSEVQLRMGQRVGLKRREQRERESQVQNIIATFKQSPTRTLEEVVELVRVLSYRMPVINAVNNEDVDAPL